MNLVLGLDLDPLTWDSVVAVVAIAVPAIMLFWWRRTEPGRTYDLIFERHPHFESPDSLAANPPKRSAKLVQNLRGANVVAYVRIRAKKGIALDRCTFKLVERSFRPRMVRVWRWRRTRPRLAFVTNVWDAGVEASDKQRLSGGLTRPLVELDPESGAYCVTYPDGRRLLAGESLWFRVIIGFSKPWEGFLEFCAPSLDGRPACTHRGVRLVPFETPPPGDANPVSSASS